MSSQAFYDIVKNRRTIYPLKKESLISDEKIQEIITQALLHVPSSFNSQSTRAVLLLKDEHDKFWDFVKTAIKAVVPAEQWAKSEERLNGFRGAYGSILFFEDRAVVSGMQEKFPLYADRFPNWATQSDAITQFTIWTALESEGLGANLQHYSPLIDAQVASTWNVPKTWELNAQLVFGTPSGPPGEKTFQSVEERFKVYGA
ncbi:Nitroreductase-like protein [Bisporella sp. PMI_857]|nr:Nitroreductase-like protein [Bisporella sp. PMI_857]